MCSWNKLELLNCSSWNKTKTTWNIIDTVTGRRNNNNKDCLPRTIQNSNKRMNINEVVQVLTDIVVRLPGCRPRGPEFDSRRCQIFWVAVDLERGPLSTCEDKWGTIWKKSSGSGPENLRLTTVRDPPHWRRDTPLTTNVGTKFHGQVVVAQSV
jgi:hypothetical protein